MNEQIIESLAISEWEKKTPTGITIHYTANDNFQSLLQEMHMHSIGYHFVIKKDGSIVQTSRLSKTTNHAGKAMWENESPNRNHISVAFVCWGSLSKDKKTYTGKKIENYRESLGGFWEPATDDQEKKLIDLCQELIVKFGIDPRKICGHDECALPKGRKVDPGGSLSFTLSDLRQKLLFQNGLL